EPLADTLERMVARARRATVVVVHGWNVVQAVCDVGIGVTEHDVEAVSAGDAHRTVSERFLRDVLRPLQRRAQRDAVTVTIGSRYPAAHVNNLLQLFTGRRAGDPHPAISRLAALADRVDAVQLELGIPLRWPGPRRSAFTQLLVAILSGAYASEERPEDASAQDPIDRADGGVDPARI